MGRVEAPGEIVAASVDGKEIERDGVPEDLRNELSFSYAGLPKDGFELSLTMNSAGPVKVTALAREMGVLAECSLVASCCRRDLVNPG